ncbi:hypothetical protein CYMTET_47727 [Cymbomonas tetramitiformis]|uniref:Uncharacterized protein n=1 Tax=Cymbomonas tetramitiformis TaxID=36881 RepID=A0AAE0BUR2_9CHLO|nr:hypothetical protein CYMTET_47727 [Cymbomonas tetramitiformis]
MGGFFLYTSLDRARLAAARKTTIVCNLAVCASRAKAVVGSDPLYARLSANMLRHLIEHGMLSIGNTRTLPLQRDKLFDNLHELWDEEARRLQEGEAYIKYFTKDLKNVLNLTLYLQAFVRTRTSSDVVPVLYVSSTVLGILLPFEIHATDPTTTKYNAAWQVFFIVYIISCIAQITVFCETPRRVLNNGDPLIVYSQTLIQEILDATSSATKRLAVQ